MSEGKLPDESEIDSEFSINELSETIVTREEFEEAIVEKERFHAMAQRAQADLINYRRRSVEEQTELRHTASSNLLMKVLSISDDLKRAFSVVPGDIESKDWIDGLRLVQRNMDSLLESESVIKIEAEGQAFQPKEHEAVFHEEVVGMKEGMIVKVIRDGYKRYDRVLRPAQVSVSKALESKEQLESNQEFDYQEAE